MNLDPPTKEELFKQSRFYKSLMSQKTNTNRDSLSQQTKQSGDNQMKDIDFKNAQNIEQVENKNQSMEEICYQTNQIQKSKNLGEDDMGMDEGCIMVGGAFNNQNSMRDNTLNNNDSDSDAQGLNLSEIDDYQQLNDNQLADGGTGGDDGAELDNLANQMVDLINTAEVNNDDSIDDFDYGNAFAQKDVNIMYGGVGNNNMNANDNMKRPDNSGGQLQQQRKSRLFQEQQIQMQEIEELKRYRSEWSKPFPWDQEVDIANQAIFGNEIFRENQREIINATKSHKDVLALIPTGGGKSLTFQLSAVTDEGVTLVIMPLLSLIEDNFSFVEDLGIPACNLSSPNQSQKEERRVYQCYNDIKNVVYKLVYLTPEKLVKSPGLMSAMDHLYAIGKIDRFVIDEVHCVSHWGQDFRKDYLHLDMLKQRYPKVPLLCLTATATLKVKDDILKRLGIKDAKLFQSSFNRTNLLYEIRDKKQFKNVTEDIVNMLRTRFKGKCGIIYCISRKECQKLSEILKRNYHIKCDYYHAEVSYNQRKDIQERWMKNEIQIIIATIAFGMGINKKDVRFVIHYSMPKSLEGYVQECGRAGRDQNKSECILYYQYGDRKRNDFFILTNNDNTRTRKNENVHALYSILEYCEEPYYCRRQLQLQFLGEKFDPSKCNKMCDNCRQDLEVYEKSYTREAQTVLRLVLDCAKHQQNISYKQAIEILRGKKPKKQILRADQMEYYSGRLKNLSEKDIRRLIVHLLIQKILKESFQKSNIRGINVQQIHVYLIPGRQEYIQALQNDHLEIVMSDGRKKDKNLDFQDREEQKMGNQVSQNFAQNDQNNRQNKAEIVREEFKQHLEEGKRAYVKQKTTNNMIGTNIYDQNQGANASGMNRNDYGFGSGNNYGFQNNNNNDYANKAPIDLTAEYGFNKAQRASNAMIVSSSVNAQSQVEAIGNQLQQQYPPNSTSFSALRQSQTYPGNQGAGLGKNSMKDGSDNQMLNNSSNTAMKYNKYENRQINAASPPQNYASIGNLNIPQLRIDDFLKEELRQRLYMIRSRLLNEASDHEHHGISNAFTNTGFDIFLQFAQENLGNNSQEILNQLKVGKSHQISTAIDKYGELFLMEFNHFILSNQLHLQIDTSLIRSSLNVRMGEKNELNTTLDRTDPTKQSIGMFNSSDRKGDQHFQNYFNDQNGGKKPIKQDDFFDLNGGASKMKNDSINANKKFKNNNFYKPETTNDGNYGFGGQNVSEFININENHNNQNRNIVKPTTTANLLPNDQQSDDDGHYNYGDDDSEGEVSNIDVVDNGNGMKSGNYPKKRKFNQMSGNNNGQRATTNKNASNIGIYNKKGKNKKAGAKTFK
eukprot:403369477